ncbi:MAG: hypothetical protein MSO56_08950 [Clostridiales bacterium]|nr:hypothetical protein [Clostridiales bacterium]
MTAEQTAKRFIRAAYAAKFHKTALITGFMEFSHCYTWCGVPRQGKVQGFCAKQRKTLALEQSLLALKAVAFKANGLCSVRIIIAYPLRKKYALNVNF